MTPDASQHAEYLLEQSRWIRSLARRLVSPDDADDLVQDTLAAALGARSRDERPSRAWLATVARRLAMKRHRTDRHRSDRETLATLEGINDGPQGASGVPSPDELVARSEQQRAVVDAVLALDEPYRSTVLLRYFEGLEPKVIAERTGIPAATVRTRLRRGVEMVRVRLDEASGGDRARWMRALTPLAGLPVALPPPPQPTPTVHVTKALPASASTSLTTYLLAMPSISKILLVASPLLLAVAWFGRPSELAEPPPQSIEQPAPEVSLAEPASPGTPRAQATTDRVAFDPIAETVENDPAAASEGVLTIINERTGQPAADLKVSSWNPEVPGAIMAGAENGPTQVTDASGQIRLSTDVKAVALRHQFDSATRMYRLMSQNWVPDDPEGIPIEWTNGAAQITVHVGHTVLLEFPETFNRTEEVFAVLTDNPEVDLWRGQPSDIVQQGGNTFVQFERDVDGRKDRWIHFALPSGLAAVSIPCDEYFDTGRILSVNLQPHGVVTGTVQPMAGGPIQSANVLLLAGNATEADITVPGRHSMPILKDLSHGVDFPFSFGPLMPGEYTLFAGARGLKPFRQTVQVKGGETLNLPIELRWDGGADARIQGRIVSETGDFHEPLRIKAWEDGSVIPDSDLYVEVAWTKVSGRWTGSFLIENVAQKSYGLTVHAVDGLSNPLRLPHILPRESQEAVPGEIVEIRLTDGESDHDLTVTAKDAVTGKAVQKFETYAVHTELLQLDTRSGRTRNGSATIHGLVDASSYDLYLVAEGYKATHLNAAALEGKTSLQVTMHPGWFRPLAIVDEEFQPVAGVKIVCDGTDAFISDAMGLVWCNLDAAPARMTVDHPGWTVTGTNFLDEDGRLKEEFRQAWDAMSVSMKRTEQR